jgi:hypothetical protein
MARKRSERKLLSFVRFRFVPFDLRKKQSYNNTQLSLLFFFLFFFFFVTFCSVPTLAARLQQDKKRRLFPFALLRDFWSEIEENNSASQAEILFSKSRSLHAHRQSLPTDEEKNMTPRTCNSLKLNFFFFSFCFFVFNWTCMSSPMLS